MNGTQIQTALAPLVSVIGGLLAVKVPYFDAGTWGQILGAIMTFGGVIWGAFAARSSAVISTAAADPNVASVKLTANAPQSLVDATPSNVQK
jgi:hypothetical protein